jgi:hypothetical protein
MSDDEQPLFQSLEKMCAWCGFDEATKEQMRIDMELTRPLEPGDTLQ